MILQSQSYKGILIMRRKKDTKDQKNPKIYVKPVVRKGPVLSNVSTKSISGEDQDCWIARAAFGVDDFRWMIFRSWLRGRRTGLVPGPVLPFW